MHPDEQIVTGEAVALELRLAGPGSRGVAALIDLVLVTVLQIGLIIVLIVVGSDVNPDTLAALLIVTEVGAVLGYPVLMETLWRGRTLGKAIMGLRVVRDDGGPIRFRHALVRGLVGIFIDKTGITLGLGALIAIICSGRKKRIGDFAAGTIVLQERVPSRIEVHVEMPAALAGWAAALDLSAIDDGLALRLRQYIGRATQLTEVARTGLEQQLVTDVISLVGPPPPGAPPWAVISAVLAERRRRAYLAAPRPEAGAAAAPWPSVAPVAEATPQPAPTTDFAAAPPYLAPSLVTPATSEPESPKSAPTTDPPPPPPASTTGFVLPG